MQQQSDQHPVDSLKDLHARGWTTEEVYIFALKNMLGIMKITRLSPMAPMGDWELRNARFKISIIDNGLELSKFLEQLGDSRFKEVESIAKDAIEVSNILPPAPVKQSDIAYERLSTLEDRVIKLLGVPYKNDGPSQSSR